LTSAAIRTRASLASNDLIQVDAALARHGRAPGRLRIVPKRRDRAEPCDRNPPHHMSLDMRPRLEVTKDAGSGHKSARS